MHRGVERAVRNGGGCYAELLVPRRAKQLQVSSFSLSLFERVQLLMCVFLKPNASDVMIAYVAS